ncbi:hypothetical protein PYCCODRAFT_1471873 [Trametes coccinea BRFM310]|uniref:Uncharacterized protein n=1 Tax=Trametes coccinea (strain BRFM310) TaxID=1353009 RepID=A0A1Y2IBT4_TRAC3|nr:hypothetical protein PYCCODRAFT_1471873 [Trametes coccinea BRFM310]
MVLDTPFLRLLEPDTYSALAPWAERDAAVAPDTSPQAPIGQLLYAANINPRGLSAAPTAAELQGIELLLVSEMLLGDKNLAHHPDLEAFASGMSIVLAPGTTLRMIFDMEGTTRDHLTFLYDRQLKDVADLIAHLEFKTAAKSGHAAWLSDGDSDASIDDADWDVINEDLFAMRLFEYLRGIGHPNHPYIQELVAPEAIAAAADDTLLRARAFLQMMSGSDLLPANPDWKLKFYFHHTGNRTAVHTGEPPIPAPLGVHACFYEATVTIDEGLRNLLRQEREPNTDVALTFDAWLHGAVLGPDDFSMV